jgi:hypothetical protein
MASPEQGSSLVLEASSCGTPLVSVYAGFEPEHRVRFFASGVNASLLASPSKFRRCHSRLATWMFRTELGIPGRSLPKGPTRPLFDSVSLLRRRGNLLPCWTHPGRRTSPCPRKSSPATARPRPRHFASRWITSGPSPLIPATRLLHSVPSSAAHGLSSANTLPRSRLRLRSHWCFLRRRDNPPCELMKPARRSPLRELPKPETDNSPGTVRFDVA